MVCRIEVFFLGVFPKRRIWGQRRKLHVDQPIQMNDISFIWFFFSNLLWTKFYFLERWCSLPMSTIYILSYFIFNISMIECLILILNAYYFFYELLFDQLNDNEIERWFVILVLELNTISWVKVEMLYRD